jgi:hypothetical protein
MFSYEPVVLSAPLNQTINSDADATIVRAVGIGENPSGSYVNEKADGVGFQTLSNLTSGSTFNSDVISTSGYTQLQTNIVSSNNGTLGFKFCSTSNCSGTTVGENGVERYISLPYTSSSGFQLFSAPVFTPYVQYSFTNNGTDTTTQLFYETKLLTKSLSGQLLGLNSSIASSMVANLGRNVIVGQDYAGNFRNAGTDSEGHLRINIDEPLTAFGELSMAQPSPQAQVDFVYGLNYQLVSISGNVTSSNGVAYVSTSASTNNTSMLNSKRFIKYRDGQGALGRYTALFTSGVTGNNQYAGLFTPTLQNGFGFGYSGTTFGIWHRSSGTTVNFIPQTSWNSDKMDGSGNLSNPSGQLLDTTKGNVYQIKFQYLGYGAIFFGVENGENGEFQEVHVLPYANLNLLPSLRNPSLALVWASENTTNNTAITVAGASGGLFIEGIEKFLGPKYGYDNNKSLGANTGPTNIFTIKNSTTYNGIINRALVRIKTISIASDMGNTSSGLQILQVHKNATLGGSPEYIPNAGTTADNGNTITNGQSIVSIDKAGTTITPVTGTTNDSYITYNTSVSRNSNTILDVSDLDIFIAPGETMSFGVKTIAGGTQQSNISVNWTEDI